MTEHTSWSRAWAEGFEAALTWARNGRRGPVNPYLLTDQPAATVWGPQSLCRLANQPAPTETASGQTAVALGWRDALAGIADDLGLPVGSSLAADVRPAVRARLAHAPTETSPKSFVLAPCKACGWVLHQPSDAKCLRCGEPDPRLAHALANPPGPRGARLIDACRSCAGTGQASASGACLACDGTGRDVVVSQPRCPECMFVAGGHFPTCPLNTARSSHPI